MRNGIRIYHAFARSGGTLVNKLLGSDPRHLVLSEVNPAGCFIPVEKQIGEWTDLMDREELTLLGKLPYARQIAFVDKKCKERGRTLIVRDWVTVNFLRHTCEPSEPSMVLEQPIYLQREYGEEISLVVVRRALDVYHSFRKNFVQGSWMTAHYFAESYLSYAKQVANWPIVKLEDLQRNPEETLRRICQCLELDFNESMLTDFSRFGKCSGDNTLRNADASAKRDRIVIKDQPASPSSGDKSADNILKEADLCLGYE